MFVGAWGYALGIVFVVCVAKEFSGMGKPLLVEFCAFTGLEFKGFRGYDLYASGVYDILDCGEACMRRVKYIPYKCHINVSTFVTCDGIFISFVKKIVLSMVSIS